MRTTARAGIALVSLVCVACSDDASPREDGSGGGIVIGSAGSANGSEKGGGSGGAAAGAGVKGGAAGNAGAAGGSGATGSGAAKGGAGTGGTAGVGGKAGSSGGAAPDCATAKPPPSMIVWLDASSGAHGGSGAIVEQWDDRARPGRSAKRTAGTPTLVAAALGGKPVVRFTDKDRLALDVQGLAVAGSSALSVALVSASGGRAPGVEWCCRADETGCSGTYHNPFHWHGAVDWGGVYVSPGQHEVSVRFGNGEKTYTGGSFYDTSVFGPSGYGSCAPDPARDPLVAWLRPASVGSGFGRTVAIKDPSTIKLRVDGKQVWSREMPGGKAAIAPLQDVFDVGSGAFNRFWKGDLAELMLFSKALSDTEASELEIYLACKWGL